MHWKDGINKTKHFSVLNTKYEIKRETAIVSQNIRISTVDFEH